jgi:iron complex outermembrane receptor protein
LYSQEFNLISPDDAALRWVVGVFAERQDGHIPSWEEDGFTFTGGPFTQDMDFPWIASPWKQRQDDAAVFGQFEYNLTESLELQVGARYSTYKMDQKTDFTWFGFIEGSPPIFPFGSGPGPDEQHIDESSVDWKVALNWTVDEDNFLYGIVARGHVSSGVNIFPPFLPYDEMEVLDYELGWKSTMLDGQLRTQIDVYYETFDNYQASFSQISAGAVNADTFRNAEDESTIWGVEMSAQAVIGNWGFDFGVAYLDSELGDFSNVVPPAEFGLPPVVDLTGAKSPFSPELTGNVGVEYGIQLSSMTITPRVDVAYIEHTQAGLFDVGRIRLDSRTLVNAQILFDFGATKATLWATNALDEVYIAGIQNNGSLFYAGAPRQYGLRVSHSFE